MISPGTFIMEGKGRPAGPHVGLKIYLCKNTVRLVDNNACTSHINVLVKFQNEIYNIYNIGKLNQNDK